MDSYAWQEHTKVRSGASSPCTDLDLLQDKYYRQFIQGIDSARSESHSPDNLSMVSGSTGVSYPKQQTLRDSVFKPIREVLSDHNTAHKDLYSVGKEDTSGESIQSHAMIEALKALQSKIARLETERAAAAEKFESLSSRTNQRQLDLLDGPVATENVLEHSRIEPVSTSELRTVSTHDTLAHKYESASHYEVERRLDSINDKCWQQAHELETTREMLRRAELDRKYTEEQMSRLERKYDELRTDSEQMLPQFQVSPELVPAGASDAAVARVDRVEERQREMAESQEQTEGQVRELQHELKLERHRRKLLQEKAAELQAAQDTNLCLTRATSLSSQAASSHLRNRGKRKKLVSGKLSKHRHSNSAARTNERADHYRVQLKDIPFVVGTSTAQSHSVAANYQQLIAMLKSHNTVVCGRGPHGAQGRHKGALPKEDSRRLIEELEGELAALQIRHQQLARELQTSQESPTRDSQSIERALRELLEQMDAKTQHVRLAKTVNKQVRSNQKEPPESSPSSRNDTRGLPNSPPVNLYSTAPLPASNIATLRTVRNLQNTLKEEDLHWN